MSEDKTDEPVDIRLARVRKLAKEGKFEKAPSSGVEIFDAEIAWILAVVAVETNQPGVLCAMVTDMSAVSDFFDITDTPPAREYFRGKIEGRLGVSTAGTLVDVAERVHTLWAEEDDDDGPTA